MERDVDDEHKKCEENRRICEIHEHGSKKVEKIYVNKTDHQQRNK